MKTYTRSPGESSVYNRSIVLDDPPAPAAREELGFDTVEFVARRLNLHSFKTNKQDDVRPLAMLNI